MISSFVQLSKGLLQERVITLLDLADLVCFDSALLNHRLRPLMLAQLNGTVLNTDSLKMNEDSAKWFLHRNVRVSSLHIDRTVKNFPIMKQLAREVETLVSFDSCNLTSTETISEFFESCNKVHSLNFSMHSFGSVEGCVLKSIATFCTALRSISLSCTICLQSNQLASLLIGCRSLSIVNLDECQIWVNDNILKVIATNSPQLLSLALNGCMDCGDGAVQVLAQHCHNLQYLSLRALPLLTNTGVSALTACAELRSVDVCGCTQITSQGIITLVQSCTKLEEIGIPQCDEHVNDAIALLVQHCPSLKILRTESPYFTDRSLRSLQHCPLLHTLELTEVNGLSHIALLQLLDHCATLERLDMPFCELNCDEENDEACSTATADAPVPAGPQGLDNTSPFPSSSSVVQHLLQSRLRTINFSQCSTLTDAAFTALIACCPSITELDLQVCSELTDAAVLAVADNCRKLQALNISYNPVCDSTVQMLTRNCPGLRCFTIKSCKLLTDIAASAIGRNCSNLRSLYLYFNGKITNEGIVEILQKCRLLRELELRRCSITHAVLGAVLQHGARLRKLDVRMCDKIDAEAFESFRSARPSIEILW